MKQISLASAGLPSTKAFTLADRTVRVLHLNAGNLYGGVETLLTTIARLRHLCPRMESHFAACYEGRWTQELAEAGAPVYLLGPARISRPWTVWRARRHLRELLLKDRFDVVICHMAWSLKVFGPAARAAGHKVIFWAHGQPATPTWLDRVASRVIPELAIANSGFTAGLLSSQRPNIPVRVLYYPVALTEMPRRDQWRLAVRREQEVSEDTTVILQVSRLEAWKGQLLHLRALAKLKHRPDWVCWIVGGQQTAAEAQYLEELKRTAEQLEIGGRVRFLGQRSDVHKLLSASDIFCQPNQGPEPFGIVFIEALWAGVPVVSTAIGGAREIVDESCGCLVEPDDIGSLAESLARLIESRELRRRLGSAGPSRARQLCDPAQQMKALDDIVRQTNGSAADR